MSIDSEDGSLKLEVAMGDAGKRLGKTKFERLENFTNWYHERGNHTKEEGKTK